MYVCAFTRAIVERSNSRYHFKVYLCYIYKYKGTKQFHSISFTAALPWAHPSSTLAVTTAAQHISKMTYRFNRPNMISKDTKSPVALSVSHMQNMQYIVKTCKVLEN